MSDEEYFEQLCSNSIDGTLTDSEREKLEAHLAECPSCAALKEDLEQMRALFAEEAEPPAGLHESIMQRLEQESKLKVVQPEKPVRRMPVFTMVAAAAAVVLVVLGGGIMAQKEYLEEKISNALDKYLLPSIRKNTRLAFAQNQNQAGMLGAFCHYRKLHS